MPHSHYSPVIVIDHVSMLLHLFIFTLHMLSSTITAYNILVIVLLAIETTQRPKSTSARGWGPGVG